MTAGEPLAQTLPARILVVDDEEMIRYLLENALARQGYMVVCAGSGQAALKQLEGGTFDLVLTDLQMPEMDGLELLRRTRAAFPATDVIVLTGHATVETAVQAMKEGAYSYLTKPFNLDELLLTVRNCLQARRLRLEKERLSELVSLLELGRTLTSHVEPQHLYDQIMAQVAQTFAPDYASIMLLDPTGERLMLMVHRGLPAEIQPGNFYPVANTIAGQVIQTQEPILLLQDALPPRFVPYANRSQIGSALCVPLSYRGRTLGVLNVARRAERPAYSRDDLQLLSVFAVQATIAIQNALLYQDLQTLERTSWQLTAILDRQQVIRTALAITRDVMQAEVAALCLWNGDVDQPSVYALANRPLAAAALNGLRTHLATQLGLLTAHAEPSHLRLNFLETNPTSSPVPPESIGRPPALPDTRPLVSFTSAPLLRGGNVFGFLACASGAERAFGEDSVRVLSTLGNTIAIALQNAAAYENLKEFNLQVITSLTTALEARDPYTRGHSERVSVFATAIARAAGLSEHNVERLRVAGLLHDIGKVRVSDLILNKPGPLTDEEWECMKKHPAVGAKIVAGVSSLRDIAPIIHHHHEYYDGSGYPAGLAGQDIPLLARILTVADGFEAMISGRSYRGSRSLAEAMAIMRAGRDRQWDGHVVDIWCQVIEEDPSLVESQPTAGSTFEE